MKKTKLIALLQALNKDEIKELSKFLESQSIKKTGSIYRLYQLLKKYHPEFEDISISKEKIQRKLFKDVKNVNRRLFDNSHHLAVLVEKFIVYKELEKRSQKFDFLLLSALRDRKADRLFFQKVNTIEKDWATNPPKGIEHFYDLYQLKKLCLLHPNYSNLNDTPIDAPDLMKLLDHYYLTNKLYWAICTQINNTGIINDKNDCTPILLNEILQISPTFQDIPPIPFLAKLYTALKENQFDQYQNLKDSFFLQLNIFDQAVQLDIFNALSYLGFQNYKKGATSINQLFELYDQSVKEEIIIYEQYIDPKLFENIVNVACAANELSWTENFIAEYQSYIPKDVQVNTTSLCEANLAVHQKDFDKALQNIAFVQYQNPYVGLQARSLQLQCYYELRDYDELFHNLVRSFSTYLKRDKTLPQGLKAHYIQFIQYTKQLKKAKDLKLPYEALHNTINQDEQVAWKKWLLQKIREL